jgi:glycosyltransferase involved in cell wall biosynthesis
MKVAFCIPTITTPFPACLDAMEAADPVIREAGHETCLILETGNPYISAARATMLRKAMDGQCDAVVFIDHDVSFRPQDLLALIEAPGDVVAGTYRFKKDEEEYMGSWLRDAHGKPTGKMHGDLAMIRADRAPAGFLKVTKEAVDRFMGAYPELVYGPRYNPSVDLFNHGAIEGVWFGEDFAFSKRWTECGGDLWLLPELQLTHHAADGKAYLGDLHTYLMRQPGGANDPARAEQSAAGARLS